MIGIEQKKEYIKWYRLAQQAVNDESIIPNLEDAQIIDLVSSENWLPIASPDLVDGRDAVKVSVYPNIYIDLDTEESEISIGLVFNTSVSIDRVRESILTSYSSKEKNELARLLHALDDNYNTAIAIKTRRNFRSTPEYTTADENTSLFQIQTNKIDDKSIELMFDCVNRVREEGIENRVKKIESGEATPSYSETPVLDLATIDISLDEEIFVQRIREMVGLYRICLKIKTSSEIRKIEEKEAKIARLQAEREQLQNNIAECLQPTDKFRKRLRKIEEELKGLV